MTLERLTIEFADQDSSDSADDSNMKRCFREFALELATRDLTPKTQKVYLDRLRYFAEFLASQKHDFLTVDTHVIREYILDLKSRNLKAVSINGYLKVLNIYWSFLVSEGLWRGSHPMGRIKLLKQERLEKQILNLGDVKRILAVPDRKSFFGLRMYCILLVFYDTAIRLNELRAIKLEDISIDQGTILINGKGRKQRVASFGSLTAKWLNRWLTTYRTQCSGEYLFCARNGNPILESTIQRSLRQIGERLGLKLSPHLIRHSAATHRAQAGMPAFLLQRYLGHASVRTTERYIHMADSEDEREKFRRFSPLDGLK